MLDREKMLKLAAGCALLVLPAAHAADQAAPPPVEYELVNDFAARLQTHLQQTAKILEQLRQTTDPAEREKLMNAYLAAVHTAARITHTMHAMLDGGKGMGKKKMGGMMKGGKCGMMGKGKKSGDSAAKPAAEADEEEDDGEDQAPAAGAAPEKKDEHAGHH